MGCSNSKETEETLDILPVGSAPTLPVATARIASHSTTPTTTSADDHTTNTDMSSIKSTEPSNEAVFCSICCKEIPETLHSTVNRPCKVHRTPWCNNCLRKLFLDACKDETRMPPSCCYMIPLTFGRRVLSTDELALFQAKHEEWTTHDRLYCPVPTCSAFIPPRLFQKGKAKYQTAKIPGIQTPPPSPPDETLTVECPQCSVHVCISCKNLSHPGTSCPETKDLDPELSELLKRLGIKRCPNCRAAVRRLFGCKHMKCRCGAQWCWWCTGPIRICEMRECPGEAEGEAFEDVINADADYYFNETERENDDQRDLNANPSTEQTNNCNVNLDAGYHWEDESLDLGSEPDVEEVHPFHCMHVWDPDLDSDSEYKGMQQEDVCGRCWRPLVRRPEGYIYMGIKELMVNGTIQPNPAAEDVHGYRNHCIRCGIIFCDECRASDSA